MCEEARYRCAPAAGGQLARGTPPKSLKTRWPHDAAGRGGGATPLGLQAIIPQAAAELPGEFDPAFKSPCWQAPHGGVHCLPYFYILVGATATLTASRPRELGAAKAPAIVLPHPAGFRRAHV